jgi:outer membrane lipoprotein carrier protein
MHRVSRSSYWLLRVGLLALYLLAAQAQAADAGLDLVRQFIDRTNSYSSKFEQILLSDSGEELERAAGRFLMMRPDRFRWEYTVPYEQVVASDGERLWLYDIDLDQVTLRRQKTSMQGTPAALLAGDSTALEGFELEKVEEMQGVTWVFLLPVVEQGDFERIGLGFSGKQLLHVEFTDRLAQRTSISFSEVQQNPTLSADDFVFEVPDYVDVIDESGY